MFAKTVHFIADFQYVRAFIAFDSCFASLYLEIRLIEKCQYMNNRVSI